MRTLLVPSALALLACGLAAQSTNNSTVYMAPATKSEGIRSALSTQASTVVTADGHFWTTSYWYDTSKTPNLRETRLFESTDSGKSWTQVTKVRTANGAYSAMAVDPDGSTIHVAWQGRTNASATYEWGVWYGKFDTKTKTWVGSDLAIFPPSGTGSYDQVTWPNVAVNNSGLVLVSGMKSNGWSAYFKVWDGSVWSSETKLQGGSYSKCHNVLAGPDDCFHFCYQSGGTYTAYYRRYDPAKKAFGAEGEILVKAGISNDMNLALSPSGDIWMTYITSAGSAAANPGTIEVAHAQIGTWKFTTYPIWTDTRTPFVLTWGNYAFYNIQMARSGDRTMVLYTIPNGTPSGTKTYPGPLYARDWNGSGFNAQRTLIAAASNAEITFPLARSDRDAGCGLWLAYSRLIYDNATPPNLIGTALTTLVEPAVVAGYGLGCAASGAAMPTTMGDDIPYLGNKGFGLTLRNGKASSAAVCFIGGSMTQFGPIPLPFDLTPLGWAGCRLYTDILLAIPAPIATTGECALPLPVPNDSSLNGAAINHQWAYIDGTRLYFTNAGMMYLQP
ncbi:MAG: hypothetical protein R3F30_04665 [Planctomycetota bacterium]